MAEFARYRLHARAGDDRERELRGRDGERALQLAEDARHPLRLDGEDDDRGHCRPLSPHLVGKRGGLAVRLEHADAVLRLQLFAARGARVAADDLRALDELAAEQPGDHRLGHHADADEGEARVAQGVGGAGLLRGVRHGDIISVGSRQMAVGSLEL